MASRRYDLLVTDMNMPVMDGVGLLDICRHNSPSLQVIIITGYEDFQYARAGVRNQAMDYLLKPVTRDDLKSALIKIKHALDKERVVRDESETMQWQLSQYYKEMKERFLLDLVKGKQLPISSIPERVRLFDLDAWQEQEVCFVTAGMQDAKQEPSELGRTPVQLRLPFQMVCHEIAQTYHQTIQIFHDPAYPGFMHFVAIGGTQRVFAERLKQQANSYLNIDVQISIGQPVKGFSAWKEGYMYALLAWNVEIRHSGPGAVGGRTAVADRSPLLPEETSRILQKCLSKGDLVTFRLMIRQELREAARISPSRLVRSIFQISLLMETAAAEFIGYTPERAPIWSSPEWH
ncbi:response regulator [Paenibacillus sp. JCM 10914]|uniref:response regulator n=1 Tax=Paenibacillus sp. JCM 10914 TaxID=1236974 RepID=UPI001E32B384|nr:response regulator [Paenibacillus sp. JCM 10914]